MTHALTKWYTKIFSKLTQPRPKKHVLSSLGGDSCREYPSNNLSYNTCRIPLATRHVKPGSACKYLVAKRQVTLKVPAYKSRVPKTMWNAVIDVQHGTWRDTDKKSPDAESCTPNVPNWSSADWLSPTEISLRNSKWRYIVKLQKHSPAGNAVINNWRSGTAALLHSPVWRSYRVPTDLPFSHLRFCISLVSSWTARQGPKLNVFLYKWFGEDWV